MSQLESWDPKPSAPAEIRDVLSLLVAGGGLTRGQVLGSSSRHSETPLERPVHYHEILATLYHQLGIDHHQSLHDDLNRPVRIMPESEPVSELLP